MGFKTSKPLSFPGIRFFILVLINVDMSSFFLISLSTSFTVSLTTFSILSYTRLLYA